MRGYPWPGQTRSATGFGHYPCYSQTKRIRILGTTKPRGATVLESPHVALETPTGEVCGELLWIDIFMLVGSGLWEWG